MVRLLVDNGLGQPLVPLDQLLDAMSHRCHTVTSKVPCVNTKLRNQGYHVCCAHLAQCHGRPVCPIHWLRRDRPQAAWWALYIFSDLSLILDHAASSASDHPRTRQRPQSLTARHYSRHGGGRIGACSSRSPHMVLMNTIAEYFKGTKQHEGSTMVALSRDGLNQMATEC